MSPKPILQIRNLHKSYFDQDSQTHVHVLKGIDLDIFCNKTIAICGPSGEGKSTLLHIMGLLDSPSSGTVHFCNLLNLSSDTIRSCHLGFVFQSYHLLDDLSVLSNILLPAQIAGRDTKPTSILMRRAHELAARVGLSHRLHFKASKLSGGEKQRCAIARALIMKPQMLFADEPTGNLDHDTAMQVANLLFEICLADGASLAIVTHDINLAKRCDVTYQLSSGKLQPTIES